MMAQRDDLPDEPMVTRLINGFMKCGWGEEEACYLAEIVLDVLGDDGETPVLELHRYEYDGKEYAEWRPSEKWVDFEPRFWRSNPEADARWVTES